MTINPADFALPAHTLAQQFIADPQATVYDESYRGYLIATHGEATDWQFLDGSGVRISPALPGPVEIDTMIGGEFGPCCVAIFLVDHAYGGPEEGGWYFECGHPAPYLVEHLRGFPCHAAALAYAKELDATVCAELNVGRRPTSSVLSEGIYEARLCEGFPAPFPTERPRYE